MNDWKYITNMKCHVSLMGINNKKLTEKLIVSQNLEACKYYIYLEIMDMNIKNNYSYLLWALCFYYVNKINMLCST